MHTLDGSNAGGQFLRTALSLAALEGEAVRVESVRGAREEPGLRPQHLAALEVLAAVTDADVRGAEVGSATVEFDPGDPRGGSYAVDVGTAGSLTLVFDALLPLATVLSEPIIVTGQGGTDVKWSPSMAYYRQVKLPLLGRFGLCATVEVDRRGFYPAGGGRARLYLSPSSLDRIDLEERGAFRGIGVYSTESASLADRDVARRQARGALEGLGIAREEATDRESENESASGGLRRDGWTESDGGDTRDRRANDDGNGRSVRASGTKTHVGTGEHDGFPARGDFTLRERVETTAPSDSAGSSIAIRIDFEGSIAGVSALGEPGVSAERVGARAAERAEDILAGEAAVDRWMADQLAVFLALAGGRIRMPEVTDHVRTSVELLERMGYEVRVVGDLLSTRDESHRR